MPQSSSVDRRQSDITAALLAQKVDAVEKESNGTKGMLERHVSECAALQKKGLVLGCLILGWIVAHSPEATKVFAFMVKIAP